MILITLRESPTVTGMWLADAVNGRAGGGI